MGSSYRTNLRVSLGCFLLNTIELRPILAPLSGFAAMGLFWGAWGVLVPEIGQAVGASDAALGGALLCVAVGGIPSMIVGGRLVDRVGMRLLAPAIAAFGLAAFLPAVAGTPVALGATLLAVGAGAGFMDTVMNAGVAAADARTGRRSMQLAHGSFAAIYALTALVVGQARSAGLGAEAILGTVTLLCLLLAVVSRSQGSTASAGGSSASARSRPTITLLTLGVVGGIAFLTENGLQSWSALFFERLLSAPPEVSSLAPATIGIAFAAGRFGGQALSSRTDENGLLLGGAIIGGTGALLFAVAGSLPVAFVGVFVAAIGTSVVAPSAIALAGRTSAPERRGAAVATVGVIAYGGFFVGPAMLGFLSEHFGLRVAMGSLTACAIVVVVLGVLLRGAVNETRDVG